MSVLFQAAVFCALRVVVLEIGLLPVLGHYTYFKC